MRFISNGKKNNYKLVYSNCSFEVWLLYHYKDIKIGECSQKNYEKLLTKQLNKKYEKKRGIKFSDEQKETAIKQSKKVYERYLAVKKKSITELTVQIFILFLKNLKKSLINMNLSKKLKSLEKI